MPPYTAALLNSAQFKKEKNERFLCFTFLFIIFATVNKGNNAKLAQLVEQRIRNA